MQIKLCLQSSTNGLCHSVAELVRAESQGRSFDSCQRGPILSFFPTALGTRSRIMYTIYPEIFHLQNVATRPSKTNP